MSSLPTELLERGTKLLFPFLTFGDQPLQFCLLISHTTVEVVNACFGQVRLHFIQQSFHLLDVSISAFRC